MRKGSSTGPNTHGGCCSVPPPIDSTPHHISRFSALHKGRKLRPELLTKQSCCWRNKTCDTGGIAKDKCSVCTWKGCTRGVKLISNFKLIPVFRYQRWGEGGGVGEFGQKRIFGGIQDIFLFFKTGKHDDIMNILFRFSFSLLNCKNNE